LCNGWCAVRHQTRRGLGHVFGQNNGETGRCPSRAGRGRGSGRFRLWAGAGRRGEIAWSFPRTLSGVNGEARPLLPHMPNSGTLTVPEKNWFIWPEFDIYEHGNVNEANVSAIMLQNGNRIPENSSSGNPSNGGLLARRQIYTMSRFDTILSFGDESADQSQQAKRRWSRDEA